MDIMMTVLTFAIYGHLETIGQPVNDQATAVFAAIGHLSSPNAIAFIFCLLVFCLAVDTQFVTVEIVFTSICDLFPSLYSRRRLFVTLSTAAMLCVGLPMCTQGGRYIYQFLDEYCARDNLILLSLLEIVCIGYAYGTYNFSQDIGVMMGDQRVLGMTWPRWSKWFTLCWKFLTPAWLIFVAFSTFSKPPVLKYGPEYSVYTYPDWSQGLGMTISFIALVGFIVTTIRVLLSKKLGSSLQARFNRLLQQDKFWGPSLVKHRVKIGHLKGFDIDPLWLGPERPVLHGGTWDVNPYKM